MITLQLRRESFNDTGMLVGTAFVELETESREEMTELAGVAHAALAVMQAPHAPVRPVSEVPQPAAAPAPEIVYRGLWCFGCVRTLQVDEGTPAGRIHEHGHDCGPVRELIQVKTGHVRTIVYAPGEEMLPSSPGNDRAWAWPSAEHFPGPILRVR